MDKLPLKYILDVPTHESYVSQIPREHPGARRAHHVKARTQSFELTYYSDHMDDEDPPFEGALMDSDANELARELLEEYVAENRLPAVGSVLEDDHVDGAEPTRAARRHRNEFTISYTIVEQVPSSYEEDEQGESYEEERPIRRAAHRGYESPKSTLNEPGTLSVFAAEVRVAAAETRRRDRT